ncbi:MAG: sigma-54-dependent Fis family transcriptional regulator [Candidatus Nitrohelix vancouverensis]|uniref:Sigma-54-dependent Fis family transcriptional regulator n=1 Tax=Candidatus Nitrohelix vancouverensis TaxID=2705534 RepID=A0A7T0G4B3_9BACT|nr:MAG: sigma-54-dependent Fis family transcriptional regulator [Candidatus Nitrohelix vancouverensis]
MPNELIFLVDDDPAMRKLGSTLLEDRSYQTRQFEDGESCLAALDESPAALFLDMVLPGMNGLEVLQEVKKAAPHIPVIMITSINDADTAVRAMQLGAYDYLVKPYDENRLFASLKKALEQNFLTTRVHYLKNEISRIKNPKGLIGSSPELKEILQKARQAAESGAGILVQGESGTGKELLARAIHEYSRFSSGLFVDINCGAIPDTLQESELFGHKKGAFTGAVDTRAGKLELANQGSLFLDEVAEMSLQTQAKLLRFLQEKTFERLGDNRKIQVESQFIAATNKDLKLEVAEGRFREDLYYRLAVFPITVPPLRERKEDIPELCKHFIEKYRTQCAKNIDHIAPSAMDAIGNYSWPGNVRQLENALFHSMILCAGDTIETRHLPLEIISPNENASPDNQSPPTDAPVRPLDETIKSALQSAIQLSNGKIPEAAKKLGLSRSAIYRMLKKYQIG